MITALMLLVCAIGLLGLMLAAIAFAASLVSIIPRLLDYRGGSHYERASPQPILRGNDRKLLHDVGIRM
jgi:hypothetical protein